MNRDVNNSLPDDIATLRQMLLERDQQIQLQLNTIQLQSGTIQSLESKVELQSNTIQIQSETILKQAQAQSRLENQIEKLLRQLYGRRSERFIDPNQLMLFDENDLKALEQEARERQRDEKLAAKNPAKKPPGHGRKPIPDHLPREIIRHELPLPDRACPCCGGERAEIGFESSEQLEYIPASFRVLEHRRMKYACRRCQEHVAIVPPPARPIEKGLPGPGLLAHTVLGKYGDHLPLYRQEDIASRHGVILRRSTLCDWIGAAADLLEPLYSRMIELVLQSRVIHTDDTSVKLVDRMLKLSQTARFWGYYGDDFRPYIVYDFTESRKRDGPAKFLKDYQGYLQADAYGGYDGIYSGGGVLEVACWAHARRKWFDCRTTDPTRSHEVLGQVSRLYEIEREIRRAGEAERLAVRQERSIPVLGEIRAWLDVEMPKLLPKSPSGTAAIYMDNQWQALKRYCDSGILSIDNNEAERVMKPCAIGRKNWLFVGSVSGGRRAAILMGMVQTCKRNGVEPWAYLKNLFEILPGLGKVPKSSDLDRLLADRWLIEHPGHVWQIDQIRRAEDK